MTTTIRCAALLPLLFLCSCAAVFGGGSATIPVDSTPRDAVVEYRGVGVGRTPCLVRVSPDDTKLVLTLDGHHPQQVDVVTESNAGLVVFGFLLWGPVELLVDAIANSWHSVDERPLVVPLTPSTSPAPKAWSLPVRMWRAGGDVAPK